MVHGLWLNEIWARRGDLVAYRLVCVLYTEPVDCAVRRAALRELDKGAELAVIGHSVGAFVSTLDAPHLKHFATHVVRDVNSWLVKLFRYLSPSLAYHRY